MEQKILPPPDPPLLKLQEGFQQPNRGTWGGYLGGEVERRGGSEKVGMLLRKQVNLSQIKCSNWSSSGSSWQKINK